jgi:hypothetical protein
MELQKAVYDVRFTDGEIWDLVFVIKDHLEKSIKTHYNNLQQNQDGETLFFEQKASLLLIMEQMFGMILRNGAYQSYVNNYKIMFEEKRKERKLKEKE